MYALLCITYRVYITLLTKATAAQNEVALSYHRVRGLYFLAVVFVATIYTIHVLFKLLVKAIVHRNIEL